MKTQPITGQEIKRQNWQEQRDQLQGFRRTVWQHLSLAKLNGRPVTTRELARLMQLDVLMVRPRVTELVQLGFARCAGKEGLEGLYESIGLKEAQRNFETQVNDGQELLSL